MHIIEAIILGAVQGLTEFIPISSSAHLIIIPWIANWKTHDLVFDLALHLGTLFALFSYFWREWYEMVRTSIERSRFKREQAGNSLPNSEALLLWPVIFACVPAALSGMYFEEVIEYGVRNKPTLIGAVTIVTGIVLLLADRLGKQRRPLKEITMKDWIIIGLAQALAIIPGVSRSGITITAGLFCGLKREAAARFSFLIGAPIIFGAGVYKLKDLFTDGLPSNQILPFILGVIVATVVGYICIGFLLNYLKKRSMGIFVAYRVVFGSAVILLAIIR
ncbi:MAG: undecaprenyl-diphosphatase UppP [Armatimonadetes bacterium]|nr:undecaprenyl-diphosphatase UppP [Armatimonadota bacterium]